MASLGAVACKRQPPPLTRVRLAIGGSAQLVYMPITLCRQLGHFAEAGLDVEYQDFPGGAKALQAMLGGSADVVCGFFDHTVQMAAEGRHLRAFVNMLRFPGLVLVVSPKAKRQVTRLDELAGLTAGVTAPGSSTHFFLSYLMAKRNVAAEEVSVVGIGHAAPALAAIESGKVDIAVLTDPALAELERRYPKTRRLADTRTADGVREAFGVERYPASVLYSTEDWIRKNVVTTKLMARAMQQTLAWIAQHTPEQIVAKLPREHQGADPSVYRDAIVASGEIFSPNGEITREGAEAVRRVLGYSVPAVKTAQFDITQTFTNEFLDTLR